jgi:hypothetical protein
MGHQLEAIRCNNCLEQVDGCWPVSCPYYNALSKEVGTPFLKTISICKKYTIEYPLLGKGKEKP